MARHASGTKELPRNVYFDQRNSIYVFRARRERVEVSKSLGKDRNEALRLAAMLRESMFGRDPTAVDDAEIRSLLNRVKVGAKTRHLPVGLSESDIRHLVARANGRCEVSGIAFDTTPIAGRRRPWAPSIDRIDSAGGYTLANCRLVCVAVNLAMNEWGIEALERIAVALTSRRNCHSSAGIVRVADATI